MAVDPEAGATLLNPVGFPLEVAAVAVGVTLHVEDHLSGNVEVLTLVDLKKAA